MPSSLMRDNVFSSPQRFDWSRVVELDRIVAVPEPTEEDLADLSFSPEELRDSGHEVPDDADEARAYAARTFKESDAYEEWARGFLPAMAVLWPCAMTVTPAKAAEAFRREGLACTPVKGQVHGIEVSGIALTGGGMDLSDHIAAAYCLCGQVPPVTVLESALRIRSPRMEQELLEAAEIAGGVAAATAADLRNVAEARPSAGPRP